MGKAIEIIVKGAKNRSTNSFFVFCNIKMPFGSLFIFFLQINGCMDGWIIFPFPPSSSVYHIYFCVKPEVFYLHSCIHVFNVKNIFVFFIVRYVMWMGGGGETKEHNDFYSVRFWFRFGFGYCCVCWNKNGVFLFIIFIIPLILTWILFSGACMSEWIFLAKSIMFLGTSRLWINDIVVHCSWKKLLFSEFEKKSKQNKLLLTHRFGYRNVLFIRFSRKLQFFFFYFIFHNTIGVWTKLGYFKNFSFFVVYFFNWKHFSFWA